MEGREYHLATILVYNNATDRMERFTRAEHEPMPYVSHGTLTVEEFRGASRSSVLWTDRRAMSSWNTTRSLHGRPIFVGYAFKRIWEGGHSPQSQHYAGVAFDAAQNLTSTGRAELRNLAAAIGAWSYVEPASLTPTWVHFDRRLTPPACSTGGFIIVSEGSRGVYVLVLQDALAAIGYDPGGLDGVYGANTRTAVMAFQYANGLTADGIVGCNTWTALTKRVVGIGQTATVIMP